MPTAHQSSILDQRMFFCDQNAFRWPAVAGWYQIITVKQ